MAIVFGAGPCVGEWQGTVTDNGSQRPWLNGDAVPQYAGAAQNTRNTINAVTVINGQQGPFPVLVGGVTPTAVATTMTKDFHNRIWVIPSELSLRNPVIGAQYPVNVWNAYTETYENTFESTELLDLTGVVTDMVPLSVYKSLQYTTANISLTPDAGLKMNGLLKFSFSDGEGFLRLIVERASIVPVVPDAPINETWTWLSQVLESNNGTEQRVSLSSTPRRAFDFNLTVIYPDEANSVIKQLFADSASPIVMPMYQYLAGIKSDAVVGSTSVVADPTFGDLRTGMNVILVDRQRNTALATISAITGEVIEFDSPLDAGFKKGSWIVPTSACLFTRRTDFERAPANGYATLSATVTDMEYLEPFIAPERAVTLTTFDGLPLQDNRPIVSGETVSAVYDSGLIRLDYGRKITPVSSWEHTQIELQREYLVDRFFTPTVMDDWRGFLDYCRGRVKPFYVPTFRPDLEVYGTVSESAGQLMLTDNRYSSIFFGRTIADQIAVYNEEGGVHYTKVLSAVSDADDRDTITLLDALPAGTEWTNIKFISLVLRCRLAEDKVEWEHHAFHSFLRFSIRTTDQ